MFLPSPIITWGWGGVWLWDWFTGMIVLACVIVFYNFNHAQSHSVGIIPSSTKTLELS